MRFLDRIEGDKLRFLGRIEGDNLLCSAKFEEPSLGALSSCMTFLHRIEGDKLARGCGAACRPEATM